MAGLEEFASEVGSQSPSRRETIEESKSPRGTPSKHGNSIFSFVKEICNEKKKVINGYFRQNPSLMYKLMYHAIFDFPAILDFDNKRTFFRQEIKNNIRQSQNRYFNDGIDLIIKRDEIF